MREVAMIPNTIISEMVYRLKRLEAWKSLGKPDTVRDRLSAIAVKISRKDQCVVKWF
jgi:hypothetical protein